MSRLDAICRRYAVALPAAALPFAMGGAGVSTVLIGPANDAELRASVGYARSHFDPLLWSDLRAEGAVARGLPDGRRWSDADARDTPRCGARTDAERSA